MIFECPKCRTTHSKPEREIGDGAEIACRKCSVPFWVTRGGVSEHAPGSEPPTPDPFPDEATVENDSGFHQASTEVMAVPPNVAQKVAEAKKKKAEAKASHAVAAIGGGTAQLGGASTPDAFAEDVATRIDSKEEIRDLITKSRDDDDPQPEAEPNDEAGLDLSVPDTLGRLEEGGGSDQGLDLSISEEERPRPSKPPSNSKPVLQGAMPEFPADALRTYVKAMRSFLLAQKIHIKIAVGAVGVLAFALFVTIVVWIFSGSDTYVAFVDEGQTLVAGPGTNGLYPQVANIERGEEVVVFDSGNVGDFLMVRDLMGRAGYLPTQSVSSFRPAARSGVPFVGCRHSPIEENTEPCIERAHIQSDSCREICEQAGQEDMACLEQCQRQMLHCIERCEGGAEDSPAVPEPEPVLEEPAVATPTVDPTKTPKPIKKKKKKKKKRRKR